MVQDKRLSQLSLFPFLILGLVVFLSSIILDSLMFPKFTVPAVIFLVLWHL